MLTNSRSSTLLICASFGLVLLSGCRDSKAGSTPSSTTTSGSASARPVTAKADSVAPPALADAELAAQRVALLDMAFEAATSLPSNPHIKTRSRRQADVVLTCLELGQLKRAAAYIERIDNWQRGEGYADLAFYLAQCGQVEAIGPYLELAEAAARKEADDSEGQTGQNWRRDRVLARIASTHLLLGETEAAAGFERNLSDSEVGRTASVKASRIDQGEIDEHLRTLDAIIATGSFDPIRNALEAVGLLHKRFYANEPARSRLEEKIKSSWSRLPPTVRVELLLGLADNALESQDLTHAGALLEESRTLIASFEWTADQEIPLRARAAVFAYRLGASERARTEIEGLVKRYDTVRVQFASADRADLLRPIAEALVALGDEAAALGVYARAIDEGAVNPNGRPRAEDLVETLLSMTSKGVTPGPELTAKISEVRGKLIAPW